jgi:EAL domain-containing protein (putative c-di-GMP-specific phosphodiesterase class I)
MINDIEDRATWERLAALNCDLAQGYYVSPPVPPADLVRWLDAAPWTVAPASAP